MPAFSKALDDLLDVAKAGHGTGSEFFNPGYDWLIEKMRVFQDFDSSSQKTVIKYKLWALRCFVLRRLRRRGHLPENCY